MSPRQACGDEVCRSIVQLAPRTYAGRHSEAGDRWAELYVRQNLYDFLTVAGAARAEGLFFIDAICINQLSDSEKESQVQEMARIFRNADQVIAWLGLPSNEHLSHVRALAGTRGRRPEAWTAAQWAGFKYLSYHRYWTRTWIVQEVLLAASMVIWCGRYTFPLSLFRSDVHARDSAAKIKVDEAGRPSTMKHDSVRLRSLRMLS